MYKNIFFILTEFVAIELFAQSAIEIHKYVGSSPRTPTEAVDELNKFVSLN
jgi:hypothetical protein